MNLSRKLTWGLFLFLVPATARPTNLCQQLAEFFAKSPTDSDLAQLHQNTLYFPKSDMAGYDSEDADAKLMTLERLAVSQNPLTGRYTLISTQAFPAGTAAPNQWAVTHPELVDGFRAIKAEITAFSPAYLTSTKDGEGKLETWDRNTEPAKPVLVPYSMKTLPTLTVRGRTYANVRRITYAEPALSFQIGSGNSVRNRSQTSTQVMYYAPETGLIRRDWTLIVVDIDPSNLSVPRYLIKTAHLYYEPIRPASLNAGLFAEHLATIATRRTADDFVALFIGMPEFQNLNQPQINALKLVYETGRARRNLQEFNETARRPDFRSYVQQRGFSDSQYELIVQIAGRFHHP